MPIFFRLELRTNFCIFNLKTKPAAYQTTQLMSLPIIISIPNDTFLNTLFSQNKRRLFFLLIEKGITLSGMPSNPPARLCQFEISN